MCARGVPAHLVHALDQVRHAQRRCVRRQTEGPIAVGPRLVVARLAAGRRADNAAAWAEVGKEAGPEDVVAPLPDVGDAPDRLEGIVRRVKVVLDEAIHHHLVHVELLTLTHGSVERLEEYHEKYVDQRL